MSFLAPLFFVTAAAVGLPILFHLIRQRPKQTLPFSSLLFLRPSPPRLTRKSRLEDWLLLLLRGLAIILIAFAFARPFLRSQDATTLAAANELRVLLVDQSASMQRAGIWNQVQEKLQRELDDLGEQDRVAIVTFGRQPQVIVPLSSATRDHAAIDLAVQSLEPTWEGGDLGSGLIAAAGLVEEAEQSTLGTSPKRTIVVISDLQVGCDTAALQGFAWPESVNIRLESEFDFEPSNASLGLAGKEFITEGQDGEDRYVRVRVTNASAATEGNFELQWVNEQGQPVAQASKTRITVPAGSTRIARMEPVAETAVAIQLLGDAEPFDNLHYVVVPEIKERTVYFLGARPSEPREDLFYYLELIDFDDSARKLRFTQVQPTAVDKPAADIVEQLAELDPQHCPLVIVHQFPDANVNEKLLAFIEQGGRVLVVVDSVNVADAATQTALRLLAGDDRLSLSSNPTDQYALLTKIQFDHPLFIPFAEPRFADFSKIQFWKHQRLSVGDEKLWNVLATFDDGAPAIASRQRGEGTLFVMAAGWQPTESQLALSTKFVPLISGFISNANKTQPSSFQVGDTLPLETDKVISVQSVAATTIDLPATDNAVIAILPGIYRQQVNEPSPSIEATTFAVNIPKSESELEPIDPAALEQLGLRFTTEAAEIRAAETERQLQDMELEQAQQWWRTLLLIAFALILLETILAMRSRRRAGSFELPTSQPTAAA